MKKERIHYLDITKGIAILYVIVWHCVWWHTYHMGNYTNQYYNFAFGILGPLMPIFMPTFFMVHAMLPKKNTTFQNVFKYGALRLLLPMVIIYPFGEMWFCWAMFFALLIDNITERISNTRLKTITILLIILTGVLLSKYELTWRNFNSACLLMPFFPIARRYGKVFGNKMLGIVGILFMTSLMICAALLYTKLPIADIYPYVSFKTNISFINVVPFYIIGVAGNLTVFWIAKSIKNNSFLEYIGRNSLLFFLFHFWALYLVFGQVNILIWQYTFSLSRTIGIYTFTCLAVFGMTYFAIKLINKYCPWIVGTYK